MAKKDTSFIFFKDWAVLIDSLNAEDRLYFWDLFSKCDTQAICEKETVKPVWNFIVSQLNKMQENYQSNIVERNQTNGKLGGRPTKDKEENPKNPMGLKKPKEPKLTQKTLNRIESNRIEDNKIENKDNALHDMCLLFESENPDKYPKAFYEEFVGYWTQIIINGKGKGKQLWKDEKTWDIGRRLATSYKMTWLPNNPVNTKPQRKEGEPLNPQSYYI